MKALTLTQPWATLVAIGAKKFETRSWQTTYRGEMAIHAAASFPVWAKELCYQEPFLSALRDFAHAPDMPIPGVKMLTTTERVYAEVLDAPEDGK